MTFLDFTTTTCIIHQSALKTNNEFIQWAATLFGFIASRWIVGTVQRYLRYVLYLFISIVF